MRDIASFFGIFFLTIGLAKGQSNLVLLVSQPGDYIGQGQTYVTTNSANFSVGGTAATISGSAFGYSIQFDGPGSTNLAVGVYSNASRYPFNGPGAGLSISGNGRGCNTLCGSFEILELHTNGSGNVDRLWAKFSQLCECGSAPLTGEVRFNSQSAPPAPVPATLLVPSQFPTIQAAIHSASLLTTDTVLVSPGIYNEAVRFEGKHLLLVSANGPSVTFIKAPAGSAGVTFGNGETAEAVLNGFTITNSSGGISVSSASPTIVSNVIVNSGTGIDCYFAAPTVRNNSILNGTGDGIHLGGAASAIVEGNIIRGNSVGISMFAGGNPLIRNNLIQSNRSDGLNMVNQSDADIIQNVIVGNAGSGINWLVPSGARGPYVINNTIAKNVGAGIYADGYDISARIVNNVVMGTPALYVGGFNDSNLPVIQFNDFYAPTGAAFSGLVSNLTGVAGNISADPAFVCLPGDDYRLLGGSPGVDAGTNGAPLLPSTDYNGGTRIRDGDTNGTARVDLGAFELNTSALPVPCLYINCQSNLVVAAPAGQTGVVVNFPPATGTSLATITSSPPSGSLFPIGTNVVTSTASYGTNSVSCTFNVVVMMPPSITNQPANVNVAAGQTINLSVGAAGSASLKFVWTFEGSAISGGTNSMLTITNAQSINEGVYRAVVSNSAGSATSAVAYVRVFPAAPSILVDPQSVTQAVSSTVTFNVAAAGSQPLSYQWFFNDAPLAGKTNAQLPVSNIQLTNAGDYYVTVTNSLGAATSSVAHLAVVFQSPAFQQGLSNQVVDIGSTVALSVSPLGTPPLSFSWQLNGAAIPGTNSTLILSNVQPAQSGFYRVAISNLYGSASSTGRVSVLGTASSVVAWGDNSGGQTNVPNNLTDVVAVAGGDYHSLALRRDGSLVAWGYNGDGQTSSPTNALRFVAVAAGGSHNLAILENGSVVGWGRNDFGQRTIPATVTNKALAIAAGESFSLALLSSGTIAGWGENNYGQSTGAAQLTGIRAIAAGRNHGLALRTNGTIAAWGYNGYGQATPPANSNVTAIAAGYLHSVALLTNGTVVAWGDNSYDQTNVPSGLSNVIAIAAGDFHTFALRADGSVVGWGNDWFGQTDIPLSAVNVGDIKSGFYHGLALISSPLLQLRRIAGGWIIESTSAGTLQWAPNPMGPYQDIPGASQNFTNVDFSAPSKFFRLRR